MKKIMFAIALMSAFCPAVTKAAPIVVTMAPTPTPPPPGDGVTVSASVEAATGTVTITCTSLSGDVGVLTIIDENTGLPLSSTQVALVNGRYVSPPCTYQLGRYPVHFLIFNGGTATTQFEILPTN